MRLTTVNLMRYFRRYIERAMYQGQVPHQYKELVGWLPRKRKVFYYGENRPWTNAFYHENMSELGVRRIPVEPVEEYHIFRGDRVVLLVGKDKGKHGIINSIIKERNWCYVEGLNCEYKIIQHDRTQPAICQRNERPLLITTQVKLVDPSDNQPTDIEWRFTEKGDRVRVSVRTGRVIPFPTAAGELEDHVIPALYKDNELKDTKEKQLIEITYQPRLVSFDEDIMESMGIKETRQRHKNYWY